MNYYKVFMDTPYCGTSKEIYVESCEDEREVW